MTTPDQNSDQTPSADLDPQPNASAWGRPALSGSCPPWCANTGASHDGSGGVRVHSTESIGRLSGATVRLSQTEAFGKMGAPTVYLISNSGVHVELLTADATALADILDALDVDRPGAVNQLADALRSQAALATGKETDQ
ncbi:hypothetical protein GCM10017673_38850 [Streptosporangium violaceochromogenes]|nr:hypothetical protein GCM10017673_38850 [Streptosporangium violaceochromogenes]